MVDVSFIALDPTLEAMKRAVEDRINSEPKRNYFGGSYATHQCDRFGYYSFINAPHEPINWKGAFAIQNGHADEIVLANRLRMVKGITLLTEKEDETQFGFSKFEGRYRGHYDGIIWGLLQAPKTKHIWEAKSVNEKKFNNLKKCIDDYGEKIALEKWDKIFYGQACIYMHEEKIDRHYLTACTPGVRDIVSCRTEANPEYAIALEAKVKRIIETKTPPHRIGMDRDFFLCRFCRFSSHCWESQ